MSGGKGGSNTSSVEIPAWLEDAAIKNLNKAEEASQIGYVPYYGVDVAGFSPMQSSAMQNTADMASAFGLQAPTDAMAGMPKQITDNQGFTGYSSGVMYDEALNNLGQVRPGQYDAMSGMFIDPYKGVGTTKKPNAGQSSLVSTTQAVAPATAALSSKISDLSEQQIQNLKAVDEGNNFYNFWQNNYPDKTYEEVQSIWNTNFTGQGGQGESTSATPTEQQNYSMARTLENPFAAAMFGAVIPGGGFIANNATESRLSYQNELRQPMSMLDVLLDDTPIFGDLNPEVTGTPGFATGSGSLVGDPMDASAYSNNTGANFSVADFTNDEGVLGAYGVTTPTQSMLDSAIAQDTANQTGVNNTTVSQTALDAAIAQDIANKVNPMNSSGFEASDSGKVGVSIGGTVGGVNSTGGIMGAVTGSDGGAITDSSGNAIGGRAAESGGGGGGEGKWLCSKMHHMGKWSLSDAKSTWGLHNAQAETFKRGYHIYGKWLAKHVLVNDFFADMFKQGVARRLGKQGHTWKTILGEVIISPCWIVGLFSKRPTGKFRIASKDEVGA